MKPLGLLLIAISLTGCAGMDKQKFSENFAQGWQAQTQARTSNQIQIPQPTLQPSVTQKYQQTDFQCQSACTKAGYEFGLCKAKCSY